MELATTASEGWILVLGTFFLPFSLPIWTQWLDWQSLKTGSWVVLKTSTSNCGLWTMQWTTTNIHCTPLMTMSIQFKVVLLLDRSLQSSDHIRGFEGRAGEGLPYQKWQDRSVGRHFSSYSVHKLDLYIRGESFWSDYWRTGQGDKDLAADAVDDGPLFAVGVLLMIYIYFFESIKILAQARWCCPCFRSS